MSLLQFQLPTTRTTTTMTAAPRTRRPRVRSHAPRVAKTKTQQYHAHLVPLMEHIHRKTFSSGHKFTKAELKAVNPKKIMKFLKLRIYDDADADPDVVPPKRYRSNTVKSWKKAWSWFMPNKMMNWDEVTKRGNPTRCSEINALIGSLIKMEVARRGMPSKARRALTNDEYQVLIGQLAVGDSVFGACLCGYFAFQVSMIARVDDTAKFRRPDLQIYQPYPEYAITAMLCWAKNCREERDAPTQVIFGAADWRYCVLSLLGVWLETICTGAPENESEFIFDMVGARCPIRIKETVTDQLRDTLATHDMTADGTDLGTHSLRKYGVTLARGNGCSKEDVNLRARWKSARCIQDTYADVTIPYIDGKVAASLCRGGPIAYLHKEGSGLTDDWIRTHVVPTMVASGLPVPVCTILGRAVMWKVFEKSVGDEADLHCIPGEMLARVMSAYRDLGDRCGLEEQENPIARLPLGVTGVDAQLIVDVIMTEGASEAVGRSGHDWRAQAGLERQEVRLLSSQVLHLRREFGDLREEVNRGSHTNRAAFGRLSRTLTRISASPAMRLVRAVPSARDGDGSDEEAPTALRAVLLGRPKTLHLLWEEYMFGGAGRKPAKDFTPRERGAVKHMYCLRKPFWEKCSELVSSGYSATAACDRIYEAYGPGLPVTVILRKMKAHKRTGDWPGLVMIRAE